MQLNILIDDAQNAVLCDFGLSRVKVDATTRSINPNNVASTIAAGSRNWMSPERILGGRLRKPADIYAFGMTIWEVYDYCFIPKGMLTNCCDSYSPERCLSAIFPIWISST